MLDRQDYIDNILDHYDNPRNKGRLDPADISSSGGNPGCGDIVVMFLRLDERGRVREASFEGEGCTISQAAASMLTEELVGKSLDEVAAMNYQDVIEDMGRDVVSTRARCATLALTIVKNATEQYLREQRAEAAESRTPGP